MDRRVDEVERLARLRDSGVLSPAEFEREKARVLGDIEWVPVASWFPRQHIKLALTAVALCSVIGLAAGSVVYASFGKAGNHPPAAPKGADRTIPAPGGPEPSGAPATDAALSTDPQTGAAACERGGQRNFGRKGELPAAAIAALDMKMADAGEDFRMTDAGPVSDLPDRRFVSARQSGCTISLRYEKGGIAHTFESVEITYTRGKWSKSSS